MSEATVPPGSRAFEPSGESPALDPHRHVPLELGTKKGVFFLKASVNRDAFELNGPAFLGHIVQHAIVDPRDRRTLLVALRTGHLGPTVFRSTDLGKTWHEASKPPAFAKPKDARKSSVVEIVFWLTPGHVDEPGVWYAGTSPEGLFRSEDGGATWQGVSGWNDHSNWIRWTGDMKERNPDGSPIHSILIDPRDPQHMYFGTGSAGVFESNDQGANWHLLNTGMLSPTGPDPHPEFGYDPHCMTLHPLAPDLLYQQNHCGIYRMRRPEVHARRRRNVVAARPRLPRARVVHGVAPVDGGGCGAPDRHLFRHYQRRGLGEHRRRRELALSRRAPAAHLLGRGRGLRRLPMKVGIPSVLQSYTAGARSVDAHGSTVAALLLDLDTHYPGIRFRMVNEADALRPHMRIFVNRESISDLDRALAQGDEVMILHALSGG